MTQPDMSRRRVVLTAALAAGGVAALRANGAAQATENDGVSRTAESIHQEPTCAASRERLYAALLDAKQFDQVIQLSRVLKGATPAVATTITPVEGSAFALFGGYITGRQLLLVQNELIVQAWRSGSWGAGQYSIARFQIEEFAGGARIIFDHRGFPNGEAQSLTAGWRANYWTPLAKLLSP
jgi:activator of HSP90 ATPase